MNSNNQSVETVLPFFASGKIINGFGRGSRDLGIPTANFSRDVIKDLPEELCNGIYYGWAKVDNSPVYKMVMSIGWNPFYKNKEKSMEIHILNKFENDFYGSNLKIKVTGFIRPELNFNSIDELVKTIRLDIEYAEQKLDKHSQMDKYFNS